MKQIQIIGGGFCGLALSYFFIKRGFKVYLVEKNEQLGGLISTHKTPYGLVESAANATLSNAVIENVANDLGITLIPTLPSAKKRFIFRKTLKRWPLSYRASIKMLVTSTKYLLNKKQFSPMPKESVRAWSERVLGKEATDYLLIPALAGIYAGDAEHLSASLILGKFFRKNLIPKGKNKGSVAPENGMGEWILEFKKFLIQNGGSIETVVDLDLPTVFAIPAHELIEYADSIPKLWAICKKIEYIPLASCTLFFSRNSSHLKGFGCLFPKSENFYSLGLLSNSFIFSGRSFESFSETSTCGALNKEVTTLTKEELIEKILADRFKLFSSSEKPIDQRIFYWPKAIPHYTTQLEECLSKLKDLNYRENNFSLFGTYLGDLGLARILPKAQKFVEEY
ncbi:MAG: FAD-dependent oxidoreductase [Oligoflexia bacterium]|nr:FAD-dependent oxidoreductase [Oligoflexia bacterium]